MIPTPNSGQSLLLGVMLLTNIYSFSGQLVLKKKNHDLNKLVSSRPKDASTHDSAFLTNWFLTSFLKVFSTLYVMSLYKNWPFLTPRLMILTNVNQNYLRIYLHKIQLFWSNGSWKENFNDFSLYNIHI